jgi:rubrerythrin
MPVSKEELVRILKKAMSMEYGALFMLPRYIASIDNEEIKRELRLIADMELEHAEKTTQLVIALGGEPNYDMPNLKPASGLRAILEISSQAECEAIAIYEKAAAACPEGEMRKTLERLRADEQGHLRLLERLLKQIE